MSADGSIELTWGDRKHRFCLLIGHLRELEARRGAGTVRIMRRLQALDYLVDDVSEILRLGLIGGGMMPVLADGMVAKYCTAKNLITNGMVASVVLLEATSGDPDDPVGKELAERMMARTTGSASRPLSEPAPQWDGPSTTSIDAASGNSPLLSTDGNAVTAPAMNGRQP